MRTENNGVGLSPKLAQGSKTSELPATLRHGFETSFGTDLSEVRIHEGFAAVHMGADAYTKGNDIHFRPGAYEPHTEQGLKLLSHELVHTIQQGGGAVATETAEAVVNKAEANTAQ